MSELLVNGIGFVVAGLEDFQERDTSPHRLNTAARNLYAGVVLLLKEGLRRLDERMIYNRVDFAFDQWGQHTVVRDRRGPDPEQWRTIDTDTIVDYYAKKRLELDARPLTRLKAIRDNIEHRARAHTADEVAEAVSHSYKLISLTFSNHLGTRAQDALGQDAWEIMLKHEDYYTKILLECRKGIEDRYEASLPRLACPSCESPLIEAAEPAFKCRACLESFEFADVFDNVKCDRCDCQLSVSEMDDGSGFCGLCSHDLYRQSRD